MLAQHPVPLERERGAEDRLPHRTDQQLVDVRMVHGGGWRRRRRHLFQPEPLAFERIGGQTDPLALFGAEVAGPVGTDPAEPQLTQTPLYSGQRVGAQPLVRQRGQDRPSTGDSGAPPGQAGQRLAGPHLQQDQLGVLSQGVQSAGELDAGAHVPTPVPRIGGDVVRDRVLRAVGTLGVDPARVGDERKADAVVEGCQAVGKDLRPLREVGRDVFASHRAAVAEHPAAALRRDVAHRRDPRFALVPRRREVDLAALRVQRKP